MHRAKGVRAVGRKRPATTLTRWCNARAGWLAQLAGGVGHLLKKNKVTVIMGEATLTAPGKISVKTDKGTEGSHRQRISCWRPAPAPQSAGLEADGELVWNYKHALVPSRMPKKLLVIGSGAIGIGICQLLPIRWAPTPPWSGDGPRAAGRGCRNLGAGEKSNSSNRA